MLATSKKSNNSPIKKGRFLTSNSIKKNIAIKKQIAKEYSFNTSIIQRPVLLSYSKYSEKNRLTFFLI